MRRAKKREGIEAQREKHLIPSKATDALIGDENQNRKQKRTKRKKVVGFSSTYIFPARKREAVTMVETGGR